MPSLLATFDFLLVSSSKSSCTNRDAKFFLEQLFFFICCISLSTKIPVEPALLDGWTSSKLTGLVKALAGIITVSTSVAVELATGVVAGVTGVVVFVEGAGGAVELVTGVVVGVTGVMVLVEGADGAVELVT